MPAHTRAENIGTRHNPHQEIKAYKDALRAFVDAMGQLNTTWEQLEFSGANVPDKGEPYPFAESFDELYLGVIGWAHDIESANDPSDWNVASDVAPVTSSVRASKIAADAEAAVAEYRARQRNNS
jgi:hypothetical protein